MINKIMPVTTTVRGDEKAWAYQETHQQSPGSRGMHRYRRILVNRDGHITEYREDMGSVTKWRGVRQLNIPSGWEYTVDELMDLACELRNTTDIDIRDWLKLDSMKLA